MTRITFAYQSWNNDFDFFNPNTTPEDNVIDGKKSIPFTHGGQYFTWESVNYDYSIVNRSSYQDLVNMGVQCCKKDFLQGLVSFKLLNTIPLGEKYIYPVSVHQVDYFRLNRHHGFKFVSPRVIKDIKNKKAKIVVMVPYEGNTSVMTGAQTNEGCLWLDEWSREIGLAKDDVYFITANLLTLEFNSRLSNVTLLPVDAFTTWLPRIFMNDERNFASIPEFQPTDDKNLYLCYNRNPRRNRKLLLANLYYNNLFDRGLISCGQKLHPDHLKHDFYLMNQFHYDSVAQKLSEITPLEMDMNLTTNNPAVDINVEHYKRTFISLIPETHYEEGVMFRSEKIWKTLAVGHPFIVFSSPGFLEALKSIGFATYGQWINESYDAEPNWLRRAHLITEEIKRLSSLSIDKLHEIRFEMSQTIKDNQDRMVALYRRDMEHDGSGPLYRQVEHVWNSF